VCGQVARKNRPIFFLFFKKGQVTHDNETIFFLKVKSLDEWITQQARNYFLYKLTMQNIEEFCFVSIVKRGHLLLPNF